MHSDRVRWMHRLALVLLIVAAYHEVRLHRFVWDTIPFVLGNPWVHEWSVEHVVAMFTRAHASNWHPVVLLSHALDFSLFGDDSGKHHLVNLFLHAANALLLYALLRRLLRAANLQDAGADWTAFATALIFGLHPQHVESVAWVVERKDLVYSLFALLALLAYLRAASPGAGRTGTALPFVLYCVALGAKPMAVSLPLVLVMLDLYPLRRVAPGARSVAAALLGKWHYLLAAAVVSVITLTTQARSMTALDALPLWARALNALDNIWFYVGHYLWPVRLSPFYPYPADAAELRSAAFWLPGALMLGFASAVSAWYWRRGVLWPALLWAFYLITLFPVLGLVQVGPAKATDHYVYLATLPLSLLTALAIVRGWQQLPRLRAVVLAFAIAYAAFLMLTTLQQVSYWANPLTLWTRVEMLYPDSAFAQRNLAAVYMEMGEPAQALRHAERSLELGSPDVDYVERMREEVARSEAAQGDTRN